MLKMYKYRRIAKKIYRILPKYEKMTDEALKEQTNILRSKLLQGKTLADILPDAFAVVIEADKRVLGLMPYYVQILGGIALFFGNIAEIKTGEGKTLVATMPLYTRALLGEKAISLLQQTIILLREMVNPWVRFLNG
ncbi:hypothetical protein [Leuconostoc citreum]